MTSKHIVEGLPSNPSFPVRFVTEYAICETLEPDGSVHMFDRLSCGHLIEVPDEGHLGPHECEPCAVRFQRTHKKFADMTPSLTPDAWGWDMSEAEGVSKSAISQFSPSSLSQRRSRQ